MTISLPIVTVIVLAAAGAAGVVALSCAVSNTQTDQTADLDELPAAFSISSFPDVAAAELAIGYVIPHSTVHELSLGEIIVQPSVELGPSVQRKATLIYDVGGRSLHLVVAPRTKWSDDAFVDGERVVFGGRDGMLWHFDDYNELQYVFPCSRSAVHGEVWCQVRMASESVADMRAFVEGLSSSPP